MPNHREPSSAPHTAREAAERLVAEGKHVHLVAYGESDCLSGQCPTHYR